MSDIKLFAKNKKASKTLIQAMRILCQDRWMDFGIEKCAMLIMRSGKRQMTLRIELPDLTFKIILKVDDQRISANRPDKRN